MNLLIDRPPESVIINGTEYPVNSDFRAGILFEMLMTDEEVTDREKVLYSLNIYFGDDIPDEPIEDIFQALIWFYRCGRSDKERKLSSGREDDETQDAREGPQEGAGDAESDVVAYSYDYDDEYIYSAFLTQYGVDLSEIGELHWWKFRAMFKALNPDLMICKIMGWRTTKISSKMSDAERENLQKLKRAYALPVSKIEKEHHDALAYALQHGGDVAAILDGE